MLDVFVNDDDDDVVIVVSSIFVVVVVIVAVEVEVVLSVAFGAGCGPAHSSRPCSAETGQEQI